jgi:hypothetical protein
LLFKTWVGGGDVVPQGMNKKLQILHLEDDPDFAELVRSLFAQDGLDVELKCVGDRVAFEAALDAGAFDVIISDYHLPSFSGWMRWPWCGKKIRIFRSFSFPAPSANRRRLKA